ncbi:MAG: SH3 domain-containing protein, partial [Chloroflexi bacterium]
MKIRKLWILAFTFVFSLAFVRINVSAQDSEELCAAITDTAFSTLELACSDMPDDRACYAHAPVTAAFSADAGEMTFDTPGDTAPLASLDSLQTSGLDLGSEALGIALIRQQVDGVPVTLLLIGEGTIRNVAQPSEDATPTLMGTAPAAGANIRRGPSTAETIVWPLGPNEQVLVTGKLADGTWLRVEIPSRYGGIGWVYAPAITLNGDINSLRTVTRNSPPPVLDSGSFGRWQALALETTSSDAPCVLAPQSGLIIQVGDPSQAATFEINGATLIVRGTAFLQAIKGEAMTIIALEGETELSSQETTETVQMGFKSSVSLDDIGQVDGPPLLASVASRDDLRAIPLNALPRPVSLVPDIPSID